MSATWTGACFPLPTQKEFPAACCSFPMATSAAFLAWGVLEFEQAYTSTDQLQHAQESLRWVADYL